MEYVAGLLFSDEGDRVALILKNRPAWQAGKFNAIGGKIELNETPEAAMRREFIEEANVDATWQFRFTLGNPGLWGVHFFSCYSSAAMADLQTMTDEPIEVIEIHALPENLIPNLRWIIPLLLDPTVVVPHYIVDAQS